MTIKEMRELLEFTQEEFAKKYNIPESTVKNWEQGRRIPPQYVLDLLERVVKIDCMQK